MAEEVDAWYIDAEKIVTEASLNSEGVKPIPGKLHPVLQVARAVIDQIHDYPTLICLSMTCHTFHSLIHKHDNKLVNAFNALEVHRPENNTDGQSGNDASTSRRSSCNNFCSSGRVERLRTKKGQDWMLDYDIFRCKTGQLPTMDWFPCYGCMTLKRGVTHFFRDQRRFCHNFLACEALKRRCIGCSINDPDRFYPEPLKYLQDMPRGVAGFRLRCSNCRAVEWAITRPRRRQEMKKLCGRCYDSFLKEEQPVRLFREAWKALRMIQVEPVRVKAEWRFCVDVSGLDTEVQGGIACESLRRFEVLSVDGT